MTQVNTPSSLSGPTLDDLTASDKHCIFRSGTSWFSVAAKSVREITIAPDLIAVPQCHRSLAGLCHLRSEFIPVIAMDALLEVDGIDSGGQRSPGHDKLMVISGQSVWALMVAEAAAIESLETLVSPETRMDDANQSPIIGTAMFRDRIVRVLDTNTIFRLAQRELESHWRRGHPSHCTAR